MSTQKLTKQFEKIYDETYKNTIKYIVSKCNDINDVDDITQETYLELYKVLTKKKDILNYKSYIIAIAKNKITEYFNSSQKVKTISIFQENNEEEYIMDFESRNRYRGRFYYKR